MSQCDKETKGCASNSWRVLGLTLPFWVCSSGSKGNKKIGGHTVATEGEPNFYKLTTGAMDLLLGEYKVNYSS